MMNHKKEFNKQKYPPPFSIRFTYEERQKLDELAEQRPLGQFIKDALFEQQLRPNYKHVSMHDRKLLAKLLGALGQSRLASNLNQLAKAANTGSLPVNEDVIKALMDAAATIPWMRNTLIKGMGLKATELPADDQNTDA